METQNVTISIEEFVVFIKAVERLVALEKITNNSEYNIPRTLIADVCGFELKEITNE